ncbi:MAG: hypothetical protein IJW82_02380 [Clostridia bacterium]|nr:hypothetical protein [Clostridia bacterium]
MGEENDDIENIGNVGFFSSIKDKAYIYNLNFVFGGNVMLPENYETHDDGTPVHVQRNQWENFEGKVGYTLDSGIQGEISYEEAFINGITNYLDFAQIIRNNSKDMQSGLFVNSYGTGAIAGVVTNATISNVTVSFNEFTYYDKNGLSSKTERATINANTPYIGGFAGYATNTKFTNCQVTENPISMYIKNKLDEFVFVEGTATINAYNNEYMTSLSVETIKSLIKDYDNLLTIAEVILEFYQKAQCVGGFVGRLDAKSNYIKFNGRNVAAHINILEHYENGDKYHLPGLNLNVGGLIGHANVASLDSVNVYGTIISAINNVGVDVSKAGMEQSRNKTELNIGGVIGLSDKSIYNNCVYQGTIEIINASQSFKQPSCVAESVVNIGGVIGKTIGDVTMNYCIATGYDKFSEVSGYKDYKNPIVLNTKDNVNYMQIGGILGNASTLSPKIKKSLFNGKMVLDCVVDNLYVGGILGNLSSSNLLTNKATLQTSLTVGDIEVKAAVKKQIMVGGIVGLAQKISASSLASTMTISSLGSSLDKNAIVYAGNFAGMLGYSGGQDTSVNDCFTSGTIRIDKANLNGAIGGFVGAMFGTVKNTYTATTIVSVSDNNPVTVDCSDKETKYVSEDGIIGPMFGFSSTVLQTALKTTAFYVFDYTGCVMRSVDADVSRYGKQIAINDIAKECIYGTTDSVMSVFAGSTSGSWKTLTYGEYIPAAKNTFSLPILSFLESDTIINNYCEFSEIKLNERIDILRKSVTELDVSYNVQAQNYELYFGSKLYPYVLKQTGSSTLNDLRNKVVVDGIDVKDSYFALSCDFDLDCSETAFETLNFNVLGYGNAINITNPVLFAKTVEKEKLISSVNFVSSAGVIETNNGIIYNTVISGNQTFDNVENYASGFITTNNGLVVNSGIHSKVTLKAIAKNAKFGLFVANNTSSGVINSCFSTATIYIAKDATTNGEISGFIHTVGANSHILNVTSSTALNVIDDDKLEYGTKISAFVSNFESSEVSIERVFVDKLSMGITNAYDFTVTKGDKNTVKNKISFVNTSYLVDSTDEGSTASGSDNLKVMYGAKQTDRDKVSLKYALAGRNYNYDYYMAYNYGYPFPALIAYYKGYSLMNALFTGDGSTETPYQIPHAGKLDWTRTMLAESTTKSFDIVNDIYMNVFESFDPILTSKSERFDTVDAEYDKDTFAYFANLCYPSATSSKPFTMNGNVNDKQYIIYYLNQNLETDAGLFELLKEGQNVKNFALTYATITTKSSKAGVLAATVKGDAGLDNVGVFNSVINVPTEMPSNAIFVGGLIGSAEDVSKINKCSSEVKINMPASTNSMNIGGLIGQTKNVKEISYCYSGSTINILDGDVKRISKTSIGGLVGYNNYEANGITKFSNCITLTCVNYSGLVGFIYNLDNYGEEYKLTSEDINNVEKITSFANIGNIVGSCYKDPDSLVVSRVNIENCLFSEDITMMAKTYAVGNNYNVDCQGLAENNYSNCVSRLKTTAYASVGARLGSRIKPFNIDGSTTKFTDFEKTTEFVIFGMVTSAHTAPSNGVKLEGKFLYGSGNQITVNGTLLKNANDCIISKVYVIGTATGATSNATGLVANNAKNTLINECMSNGSINSPATYVGGIVGYGDATVIKESTSYARITSDTREAVIGGVAGQLERGGYWFCKSQSVSIDAKGQGCIVGGVAGVVPKNNSFIINCEILSGIVFAGDEGTAGGLVGHLDGLIASGKIGQGGATISMNGYYVGGVAGTVREGANNIFLNGFTVNIKVTSGQIVGGVASYLVGAGYTIKNTTVNGTLRGEMYVGGIAGYTDSGVKIGSSEGGTNTINATISATGNNIGGIVGEAISTTIVNNIVNSNINGIENVGGIAGKIVSSTVTDNQVKNGRLIGETNVGGIVGYVHQPGLYEEVDGNSVISNNTCSVYVQGSVENIGGIVGFVMQSGTLVQYNTHNAEIYGADNVGGIVGASSLSNDFSTGVVLMLYNNYKTKGKVSSSGVVGGIIGYMASTTTKENVLGEEGVIAISGETAGGIIGKVSVSIGRTSSDESSTIQSDVMSDKAHTISGTKNAGGIVGIVDRVTRINKVVVNVSSIAGENAGGIVGYGKLANIESWTTLKFSRVSGTNVGGLIGYAYAATIGKQSLDSKLGILEGYNCGGYFGYAYGVTLLGEEEEILKVSGYTVNASVGGGSIGSIIGHANASVVGFINVTNVTVKGSSSMALGGILGTAEDTQVMNTVYEIKETTDVKCDGITGSATNVGGIVGRVIGENSSTIALSTYNGKDLSNSATNVGGIVGSASFANISENSILNTISITAVSQGSAGGIVGYSEYSTIENKDTVKINIKDISASNGNAGGIVGYGRSVEIKEFNLTTVNSVNGANAGGIAGKIHNISSDDSSITNITFTATEANNKDVAKMKITGKTIGGAVGYADGNDGEIKMTGLKYSISQLSGNTQSGHAGGVAGYAKNCNLSSTEIYTKFSLVAYYAGGVFGQAENCTVSSTIISKQITISDAHYAGGIMGEAIEMKNINNPTDIIVNIKSKYAGGIVGKIEGDDGSIKNVNVSGYVEGSKHTGGVAGWVKECQITNCDLSKLSTSSSGGETCGGIAGYAEDCEIKNIDINGTLQMSGVKCAGSAVGKMVNGELTLSSPKDFSMTITGAKDACYGAYVGDNSGNITISPSNGTLLQIKMTVANAAGNVGGFVGMNTGNVKCNAAVVGVSVKAETSKYVGGVCGTNNGTIEGTYSFYYQVTGETTAGMFAAGTSDIPRDVSIYIHKYSTTEGKSTGTNSALGYANARVNGGLSSTFKSGSTWGTKTYMVYPGEKFNYDNQVSNIRILNDDCKGYSTPSLQNVNEKVKSSPAYLKADDYNVYLQCEVSTAPSLIYYYANWGVKLERTGGTNNTEKSYENAFDHYYPGYTNPESYEEVIGNMITSKMHWAYLNNTRNSKENFNIDYTSMTYNTVALNLKRAYNLDIDEEANYNSWSSLRDEIEDAVDFTFGIPDTDEGFVLMQKWAAMFSTTNASWDADYLFKNTSNLEEVLAYGSNGHHKSAETDETLHDQFMTLLRTDAGTLNSEDNGLFKSDTHGNWGKGGITVYYDGSKLSYYNDIGTLSELYQQADVKEVRDGSSHETKIATIHIDYKADIDTSGTSDNLLLNAKASFDIYVSYTYGVGISPAPGAPGVYTFSGASGEYPTWKQGGSSPWANDLIATKTIGQVGCLMTSVSCVIASTGAVDSRFNPGVMNNWLKNNGGYTGNCLYWASMCNKVIKGNYNGMDYCYDLHGFKFHGSGIPYNAQEIGQYFNSGRYKVIVWVYDTHFCAVVGAKSDGSSITIMDPARGDVIEISNRYKNPLKYALYTWDPPACGNTCTS